MNLSAPKFTAAWYQVYLREEGAQAHNWNFINMCCCDMFLDGQTCRTMNLHSGDIATCCSCCAMNMLDKTPNLVIEALPTRVHQSSH